MIESNDGGVNVTTDGGVTWTPQSNQPTAQFYRVSTDTHFPYRILGAQQDNSAVRILSRGSGGGIGPGDWDVTAGGESGYIVADPRDSNVVFGGSYGGLLTRFNHATGETRDVNPWPDNPMGAAAGDIKYRFQWNFPIVFSPNDPAVLYTAAQVLFKSTDAGQSWTAISGDLTRNDKSRLGSSGGPITKDNTSVEYYGTIFTIAESPLAPERSGPARTTASSTSPATAARPGRTSRPKAFRSGFRSMPSRPARTTRAAPTWRRRCTSRTTCILISTRPPTTAPPGRASIPGSIPGSSPASCAPIPPAAARRGLLYAGTEQSIYVSFDDGAHWQSLQLNLPIVPVADLTIKDGDLVAATQGRGFWVLDDLQPLREQVGHASLGTAKAHLYPHRTGRAPVVRLQLRPSPGRGHQSAGRRRHRLRPQGGASPAAKAGKVKLEILGADGKVIQTFVGKPAEEGKAKRPETETAESDDPGPAQGSRRREPPRRERRPRRRMPPRRTRTRTSRRSPPRPATTASSWDLHWTGAAKFPGMILWSGDPVQAMAVPGRYQARLTAGGETLTQDFEIRKDPRSSATQADLEAQFQFLQEVRAKLTETHDAIRRIRDVRTQLQEIEKRLAKDDAQKPVVAAAKEIDKKMTAVEEALYQTKSHSSEDPLNFPIKLNDKLNSVADSASLGDNRPTAQGRGGEERGGRRHRRSARPTAHDLGDRSGALQRPGEGKERAGGDPSPLLG